MIPFRTALRTAFLFPACLSAVLLALPACQNTPTPVGIGTRGEGGTRILERAPLDIAVLPVVNNAGKLVPAKVLRGSFQQGLVERRYSPLALEYVDRQIREASYDPGAAQEQGVCTIQVDRWDTTLWESHDALTVSLTVRIVDAQGGEELWKGIVERRFDLAPVIGNLPTETQRIQHACDLLAAEVLQKLPLREARGPAN